MELEYKKSTIRRISQGNPTSYAKECTLFMKSGKLKEKRRKRKDSGKNLGATKNEVVIKRRMNKDLSKNEESKII